MLPSELFGHISTSIRTTIGQTLRANPGMPAFSQDDRCAVEQVNGAMGSVKMVPSSKVARQISGWHHRLSGRDEQTGCSDRCLHGLLRSMYDDLVQWSGCTLVVGTDAG
jgi:hypothetical protein